MMSKSSVLVAVALALFSALFLGMLLPEKTPVTVATANNSSTSLENTSNGSTPPRKTSDMTLENAKPDSKLPVWDIDYEKSHITFTGEQAGAPFIGKWQIWEGKLQFDAKSIDQARFDVNVEIASVSSNDDERDKTILSTEFFDAVNFPTARFTAQDFKTAESGFIADGLLTIKGIKQAVPLAFTVQNNNNMIVLKGQAILERHAWEVGTGDWADPTWVGSDVVVDVLVRASF